MCFKSSTKHILNDNPSMGNVKRYLGTCKIQAPGLNVDPAVINGNVSRGPNCARGTNLEVKNISGSEAIFLFVFTIPCLSDI